MYTSWPPRVTWHLAFGLQYNNILNDNKNMQQNIRAKCWLIKRQQKSTQPTTHYQRTVNTYNLPAHPFQEHLHRMIIIRCIDDNFNHNIDLHLIPCQKTCGVVDLHLMHSFDLIWCIDALMRCWQFQPKGWATFETLSEDIKCKDNLTISTKTLIYTWYLVRRHVV